MLFRLCEHYSFNDGTKISFSNSCKSSTNENIIICFICFEERIHNQKTTKLNNQLYFIKTCQCDGNIHQLCLERWFSVKEVCPICRNAMIEKPVILFGIFNNKYMRRFYLFCARNYLLIIRYLFMITIFYFIFEYTVLLDRILYKSQEMKNLYFEEEINYYYHINCTDTNTNEQINRIIPAE